jgi:hypothetical protein
VLEGRTSFRFRARLEADLTSKEREETLERIRAKMDAILTEKEMENVRYAIEEVDDISIDPKTGKFRLVVREDKNENATNVGGPTGENERSVAAAA